MLPGAKFILAGILHRHNETSRNAAHAPKENVSAERSV
jgi:hypothetical protein